MATTPETNVFSPTIEHLKREKEIHRNDEMTARGKVTECDELIRRLQSTCHYCGKHVYSYREDNALKVHIEEEHWKEVERELEDKENFI